MICDGKVVIVTGGTSGIGEALVRRFRHEGAHVIFNGRRHELGGKLAVDTSATYVWADVTIPEDIDRTIRCATQIKGHIDVLINNAGYAGPYDGLSVTPSSEFSRQFHLHIVAALDHIRSALSFMRGGSVINITSVAGHKGFADGRVPYAVSKAALIALTHSLAPELKNYGIRINSVSPGRLETGLDPVVEAVLFLATDAARFCTGIDLVVDGGWSCGSTYIK